MYHYGLMQNNIFGTKHIGKSEPVAVSRNGSQECSHCTIHCNCDATRLNMVIPVAVSLRPSPTVAARRKGITHQAILCNWPVADNRVASRRLVWARLKSSANRYFPEIQSTSRLKWIHVTHVGKRAEAYHQRLFLRLLRLRYCSDVNVETNWLIAL